jgi:hypothetical protein
MIQSFLAYWNYVKWLPTSLSAGSISRRPLMKERALYDTLPTYLFARVSTLEISGNLKPTYLGFLANSSCYSPVSCPRIF